jgi:EAL domain-containing protein (putative c-di-GMP-specific phosphodiesterase class I)
MSQPARLLGFAFANADLLFEINPTGTVLFAAGATTELAHKPAHTFVGSPATTLFSKASSENFSQLCRTLGKGERSGPHELTMATGSRAHLALFRLPDNAPNISCTLLRKSPSAMPGLDSETGVQSLEAFLASAANTDSSQTLSLLDISNLREIGSKLSGDAARALFKRIGDSLKASGASAAGRLSETTFGTLSDANLDDLQLANRLAGAFRDSNVIPPAMNEFRMALRGDGLSEEQRILAMRYVLDQFSSGQKPIAAGDDIGAAFSAMIEKTQMRLADMTRTLGDGAFQIAYQPIRDLVSGKISHYEALARFDKPEGTGETVKFIEALGVADAFDLAVANKVMSLIEQRPDVQIAFNISGATLASAPSFGVLAGMLARRRKLAPRTLIEITETVGLTDLEAAGKAIGALREMGYRVGLDDFGAGAASVNYLQAFQVDFVKFDGGMIMKMGKSPREDALLTGLAKLCDDLKVTTIAEWIEDEAMANAARALGFHHGQGKWLGAPTIDIPSPAIRSAKRRGVVESWG